LAGIERHAYRMAQIATGNSEDERRQAGQQSKAWQRLPDKQKKKLRQRFELFKQLLADKRQTVLKRFRKFKSLPPTKQKALKQKWRRLSPEKKRQLIQLLWPMKNPNKTQPRPRSLPRQQRHLREPLRR